MEQPWFIERLNKDSTTIWSADLSNALKNNIGPIILHLWSVQKLTNFQGVRSYKSDSQKVVAQSSALFNGTSIKSKHAKQAESVIKSSLHDL